MKIAACVVLYDPQTEVANNVKSYLNDVGRLYIVDNSKHLNLGYKIFSTQSKVKLIHDGKNEGIAKRLNQVCDLAIKDGFDYLLTMDQDSFFDETSMQNYFRCVNAFPDKENAAMFGVNYNNEIDNINCNVKKVRYLITSGSIINLSAYKKIGGFDENLFIDLVDTEYCFRSIINGFDIIEFSNIYLHHRLGEITQKRSLKNLQMSKRSFHSPVRLYYMTRNFLYVNHNYKNQFKKELLLHKRDVLNRIKNSLLYKSKRIETVKFLIKAFSDFKKNKMGKLLESSDQN